MTRRGLLILDDIDPEKWAEAVREYDRRRDEFEKNIWVSTFTLNESPESLELGDTDPIL